MKFILRNVQGDMFNIYPKLREKYKSLVTKNQYGDYELETGSFKTILDIPKLTEPTYGIIIRKGSDYYKDQDGRYDKEWIIIIYDGLIENDEYERGIKD